VLRPLHEIGRYGGTWRRAFTGPGDSENGNRMMAGDKLIFFDASGTKMEPSVAKRWEVSADGRRTTLFLRRGMKWSDGEPFTADDFMFWFNDINGNKDLLPSLPPELSVNGKPGRMVKLDETTIAFEFDEPYFLFVQLVAGDTPVGGGQARLQSDGQANGLYAPAHYLKRFLPKYRSDDELKAEARAAGVESWVSLFKQKSDWRLNRDLPTLSAWHMVEPINGRIFVLDRNPYYYAVDTEGNQLPYIDRVQMTLAENPDLVNLRAVAGEYDYQERFMDLAKLPVFIDNAQRGHYKVHLDLGFSGSDTLLFPNLTYQDDAEVGKWLGNAQFRRALSLGIDRDQINDTFFLGLGTASSAIPADIMPESPGEAWRTRWSTYDPAQANAILDSIGLAKKDADGIRLRTDNGKPLRLEISVAQTLTPTWPQQMEMVAQHWRRIGIVTDIKVLERRLAMLRIIEGHDQLTVWNNGGTESLYLYPRYALPVDVTIGMGSRRYADWFGSDGQRGQRPSEPEMIRAFQLLRDAAGQPEAERNRTAQEIWKLIVEQQWNIGIVGLSPASMGVRVVNERLENVPARTCISQQCRTPWGAHPEQWFYR
jgi:peptide/nickel transport system substrate-binding protein